MPKDKPVRQLASTVQTVDAATGKVVKTEGVSWSLIPPPTDHCQFCAVKHDPALPHNRDSLYYQTCFENQIGRAPTWADAMAHCTPAMRQKWIALLKEKRAWKPLPKGETAVAHHGII